eukprot:7378086-Prymnesium_polylepis.1
MEVSRLPRAERPRRRRVGNAVVAKAHTDGTDDDGAVGRLHRRRARLRVDCAQGRGLAHGLRGGWRVSGGGVATAAHAPERASRARRRTQRAAVG